MVATTTTEGNVRIDARGKGEWCVWGEYDNGVGELYGHYVREFDGELECSCYNPQPCRHVTAVERSLLIAAGQMELGMAS